MGTVLTSIFAAVVAVIDITGDAAPPPPSPSVGILFGMGSPSEAEAESVMAPLQQSFTALCTTLHQRTAQAGPSLREDLVVSARSVATPCQDLVKQLLTVAADPDSRGTLKHTVGECGVDV